MRGRYYKYLLVYTDINFMSLGYSPIIPSAVFNSQDGYFPFYGTILRVLEFTVKLLLCLAITIFLLCIAYWFILNEQYRVYPPNTHRHLLYFRGASINLSAVGLNLVIKALIATGLILIVVIYCLAIMPLLKFIITCLMVFEHMCQGPILWQIFLKVTRGLLLCQPILIFLVTLDFLLRLIRAVGCLLLSFISNLERYKIIQPMAGGA